jgi:hypothetical protein
MLGIPCGGARWIEKCGTSGEVRCCGRDKVVFCVFPLYFLIVKFSPWNFYFLALLSYRGIFDVLPMSYLSLIHILSNSHIMVYINIFLVDLKLHAKH